MTESTPADATRKPRRRKAAAQPEQAPADNAAMPAEEPETAASAEPAPKPATALVPVTPLSDEEITIDRVAHLSRDLGWTLVTAGVVGIVMPGVLGTPFLVLGAMVLWPGNRERVERWRRGHSPKALRGAMKQINRFLDDLEKRYPRDGR